MNYFFILIPLLANMLLEVAIAWKITSEEILISKRHRVRIFGIIQMAVGFVVLQQFGIVQVSMLHTSWLPNATTLVVTAFAAMVAFFAALVILQKQPILNEALRSETSNSTTKLLIGLVWIAYLICYESYLRIFLFPSQQHSNATIIIVLNVLVYAALHLHRPKSEMIATIPFGFLVCYCTLVTGSVWPAFAAHAVIAWVTHLGVWPFQKHTSYSAESQLLISQKHTL